MTRTLAAALALAAGVAIALPMAARSADAPPIPGPAGEGMHGMGMMDGMRDHPGAMGRRGMMHEMMMHRMQNLTPQQRCDERLARRAGVIAYTVAKLHLTAEQRPLWDKLQGLLQNAADKERQLCAGSQTAAEQTILDRVNRREQFLSARLQGLQQMRPALEQFYQALTPEQQTIINHPFRR